MSAQTPEIPSDSQEAMLGRNSASASVSTGSSTTPSQTSNIQTSAAPATGSTTSTTPAMGTGSVAALNPLKASYQVSFHLQWKCRYSHIKECASNTNFMLYWEHSNFCKRRPFPARVLPTFICLFPLPLVGFNSPRS